MSKRKGSPNSKEENSRIEQQLNEIKELIDYGSPVFDKICGLYKDAAKGNIGLSETLELMKKIINGYDYSDYTFKSYVNDELDSKKTCVLPASQVKICKEMGFDYKSNKQFINKCMKIVFNNKKGNEALLDYCLNGWSFAWKYFEGKSTKYADNWKSLETLYDEEFPVLPQGLVLFEGQGRYEPVDKLKVGQIVTRKRPTSTSVSIHCASNFLDEYAQLICYTVKGKNVKGYAVPSSFTEEPDSEQEVHIRNGMKFKVISMDKRPFIVRCKLRWAEVYYRTEISVVKAEIID